jgi:DeoR family transcriptional regulator of aga operon
VRPNLKLADRWRCRAESYELVGPFAESALDALNPDVAIGVDGISVDAGLTTHHEVEAHTNRAMISRAYGDRGCRQLQGRPGHSPSAGWSMSTS